MCAPPLLRNSPSIAFEMVPVLARLLMSLSHPFHQRSSSTFTFYTSLLETVSGVMSSALFAPASSVSSFSTLEIFQDTNRMWWSWLLCIRGCLVGHFPRLWHVRGCTSTGVFKGGSLDVKHWDACQSLVMMACDPTDSSWGSPPETGCECFHCHHQGVGGGLILLIGSTALMDGGNTLLDSEGGPTPNGVWKLSV